VLSCDGVVAVVVISSSLLLLVDMIESLYEVSFEVVMVGGEGVLLVVISYTLDGTYSLIVNSDSSFTTATVIVNINKK
jgi:hypothetical protein